MRFRTLGPLEIWDGHAWSPVAEGQHRALLALLLLHQGRHLDRDWLIEALWPGQPPSSAGRLLSHYVWRLRTLLPGDGPATLRTAPHGYVLAVPADQVDHEVFTVLVDAGRVAADAGHTGLAITKLGDALALWRGPALADLRSNATLAAAATQLEQRRWDAMEALAEAWLADGGPGQAAAVLGELTTTEPYRERPWLLLMRALHRAGRRPDAIATYRRWRRVWTDELGVEPGREAQELHRRLIADDPSLAGEPCLVRPAEVLAARGRPAPAVPVQLPPDIADFTGRDRELADLVKALGAAALGVVVHGAGGVGKTALAIRAGHALRRTFPDGQLVANLHDRQPARVLEAFLRDLGVDRSAIPAETGARAILYRAVLAHRRVLVVLDSAADEAQVVPLLPPAGCAVVVTSRRPLANLEGFARLRLDGLDTTVARDLLARVAGAERVRAETVAAGRIVELCGGLPLAVRAAAARLATRPEGPLALLAARLVDERRRLDGVADLEVRAGLALGYDGLDPRQRGALGAVALAPAGDVAPWLIAAAYDVDEREAASLAESLVCAQLLGPAGRSRYRVHGLTRLVARERSVAEQPEARRAAGLRRWLTAAIALAAHAVRSTGEHVRAFDPPAVDPLRRRFGGTLEAIELDPLGWYRAERDTLVAAVDLVCHHGLVAPAWQLAHVLATFFEVDGDRDDWRDTHTAALAAARAGGQRTGEAALLSGLGQLAIDRGDDQEALALARQAVEVARGVDRGALLAIAVQRLGNACQATGAIDEASACYREGLALSRAADDRPVQAMSQVGLGTIRCGLGQYDAAVEHLERALSAIAASQDHRLRPFALANLALAHREAGRLAQAIGCYERAVTAAERVNDQRLVQLATRGLGEAHRRTTNAPI